MTANSLRAEEFATGPADRPGEDAKGTGKGAGRPRRGRRILKWSAATLAMLVIGTAGAGFVYYEHLNGNIKKARLNLGDTPVPEATPNAAGQTPLNILMIGSDSRNTASDLKLGGSKGDVGRPPLGDVQMLLHLSADRSNMSVISLPRDTMIPIPKCTDPDTGKVYPALSLSMANESLGRGGPGCTVATWTELTGVHIDHFMMVDFSGVVSMADAIGGVPVCVKQNVWSHTAEGHGSGLKLEKGTHPVKGKQALQWLRTRYGFEDGTDIGRTHAQHMYINSMVRQLRANARLGNPEEMRKLAEAATDALTVDEGLGTVKKLYDLSMELQKVPTDGITMTTLPTVQWTQDRNRLVPAPGDAEQLISMVRDDDALTGLADKKPTPAATSTDPAALPADIAVRVRNGTGTAMEAPAPQRASAVTKLLQNQGFSGATADTTPAAEPDTEVLYPGPDQEGDAQAVADALHIPLKRARQSDDVQGVTLVVGADWRTGDTFPKPKPKKVPESAAVLNGEKADACMDIQQGFTW
ncbi:LytR family transcriptional regulator [Streptomyces sp. SID4985]|uniref:LCP family protein n=1 Tax=Streptomyces sp. SID4985 TaxID=2690292 RepID=UPI001370C35A|nr:LCP family protein [Streptomyces sp. SID4985]MYQ48195.1 LytR family transcriptional regulator [Streptomyces sp. SID4985]